MVLAFLKKERKKTDNPREGWEDGTPPPHRDFKERRVQGRGGDAKKDEGTLHDSVRDGES